MSDEIVRSMLRGVRGAPSADRYHKGLFGSYVRRAEDTLHYATALGGRTDARAHAAKGLTRATEQVCKAVRVVSGQSASRSREPRTLLLGDESVEAMVDVVWRRRIAPLVTLSELGRWTDEQISAWTSALAAIIDDLAKAEPVPRRPARAFRFATRSSSIPARDDR